MKLKIDVRSIEWWIWALTLALIVAALAGWKSGYAAVIVVSFLQAVLIAVRTGSALSFASQIRLVYLAFTLLGLWEAGRVYCYALLAVGTTMVVLFDRCGIALMLKQMPWNRRAETP
jgi:hypothetical protein